MFGMKYSISSGTVMLVFVLLLLKLIAPIVKNMNRIRTITVASLTATSVIVAIFAFSHTNLVKLDRVLALRILPFATDSLNNEMIGYPAVSFLLTILLIA